MKISFKTNIKKIDINNDILNLEFYGIIYHSRETFISLLKETKNKDELLKIVKKIPGVWFIKAKINNETILISDSVGGLRVYYTVEDNKLYLFTIFSEKPYEKIEIHKEEELFWKRHNYTTGIGTLDKRIYKFPPASYIIINNNEVIEKLDYRKFNIYLDDIDNTPNDKKLKDNIFSDLEETIKALKGKTVLLAWSGGLDSNLLVILLKEYKINFIPYYLSFYPKDNDFLSDDYKVEKMSKILGIEPFIINIDLKILDIDSKIIKDNLNDKHWGFYIFGDFPVRKILQSHNLKKENIVILSGQSSDSIFTWGISWKAFGGVLQRYLIIKFLEKSLITKKLMAKIYTYLFDKRWGLNDFIVPNNDIEFKIGLLDNKTYLPIIKNNKNNFEKKYYKYLNNIIDFIDANINKKYPRLIYYKLISHLASAPNYSWTFHLNNGINVILPFSTPKIINSVLKYQNFDKIIFKPRFILFEIAKDLNVPVDNMKVSLENLKSSDDKLTKKLINKINSKWEIELDKEKL